VVQLNNPLGAPCAKWCSVQGSRIRVSAPSTLWAKDSKAAEVQKVGPMLRAMACKAHLPAAVLAAVALVASVGRGRGLGHGGSRSSSTAMS
jgi:hypothetical protein